MPKAFSPEFFYQRGLADAPLYADAVREWKALHKLEPFNQITPMTMAELPAARFLPDARMKLQSLPLARFGRQADWDAQRFKSPRVIDEFRSAASIYIGIYAAAAGMPRDMIQGIQNDYAGINSDYGNQQRDHVYHHLAEVNVGNVDIGYNLVLQNKIN